MARMHCAGALGLLVALAAVLGSGCAVSLAEARPARVLDAREVRVAVATTVVAPLSVLSDIIDPARAALDAARSGRSLSDEEERSLVAGAMAIALAGPGVGAQLDASVGLGHRLDLAARITNGSYGVALRRGFDAGRWDGAVGLRAAYDHGAAPVPYLDEINAFVRAVDSSRFDGQLVLQLGRELGEVACVWVGAKAVYSPYRLRVDASAVGLGVVRASSALAYYGGFAGLALGYRWVHLVVELTAAWASGSVDALGRRYDLSGLTLVPALGLQLTF